MTLHNTYATANTPKVSNVSAADQAVATACAFLFRALGAAVGLSLVGMRLRSSLNPQEAERIIEGIAQSLEFIKDLSPELQKVVRNCYGVGIQAGFGMCVALLACAAFSTFWWREKKLER